MPNTQALTQQIAGSTQGYSVQRCMAMTAMGVAWIGWWNRCLEPRHSIWGALQDDLQALLGVSVDVITRKALPAKFQGIVAQEARPV